jgi:hypothetical protein
VQSVESQITFQRNMSPPSSWSKNKPSKETSLKQVSKRATCFSEMSFDFQRAKQRYIPEDRTLRKLTYLLRIRKSNWSDG